MDKAIQLFGFLILTILGFVLPIMAILLSIFQEGISKLANQSENARRQSENNIKKQLKKIAETGSTTDTSAIQRSLKELESIKKTAESKLSYLDPKKQVIRLFISLILAFLGVVVALTLIQFNIYYSFFLIMSLSGFSYAVFILWKLIGVIIEVKKTINIDERARYSRTTELLSALVKKTEQYYLKKVYITLNGKHIKNDSCIVTINVNNKKELGISIDNKEYRMAKNVEIGFVFPTNFIIEDRDYFRIYRNEEEQIVRYQVEYIHGRTNQILRPLPLTPLEKGDHEIETFIKAENIEAVYRDVTIKVT